MSQTQPRTIQLKNGATLVVRTSTPQDAHSFVQIMHDVVGEGRYTLAEPDEVSWTDTSKREEIKEHREDSGDLSLVAEVNGKVVGFIEFDHGRRRRTRHTGMFSIFIQRGYRELGIGSALISTLLDWATAHPYIEKVTLAVFASNQRAIAVYQKLGFQIEGRCPNDMKIGAQYMDSILMYKFVK